MFTWPGATISADQVFRDITTKIARIFQRLRMIGFAPAFAPDVAQRLNAHGCTMKNLIILARVPTDLSTA